jgi:hypothetical protein
MVAAANRSFVTQRSNDGLADALQHLLLHGALRREIGAANREKALSEYDQSAMFAGYRVLHRPKN